MDIQEELQMDMTLFGTSGGHHLQLTLRKNTWRFFSQPAKCDKSRTNGPPCLTAEILESLLKSLSLLLSLYTCRHTMIHWDFFYDFSIPSFQQGS